MKKLNKEVKKVMVERFGKDTIIALATIEKEVPYIEYNRLLEDTKKELREFSDFLKK